MKISDIESKEFNLKFSFEKLVSNLMYLQKILEMYPDKNSHPHKDFKLGSREFWELSKDIGSDDEDEIYDPNSQHTNRRGPKINVKKNRW